jgi:hypothetical protein
MSLTLGVSTAKQERGQVSDVQRWNVIALLCLHGIYFNSQLLQMAGDTSIPFLRVIKSFLNNELI